MSDRNPLQPLTGVVRVLWAITTAGLMLGVAFKVANAIRDAELCFNSTVAAGRFQVDLVDQGAVRGGTRTHPAELRFCVESPTGGDRVLGAFDGVPSWLAYAFLLYLLMRLLQRATAEGVHTTATADRLRRLGWFTLVFAPVTTLIEAFVRTVLVARAVTFEVVPPTEFLYDWHAPWWAVVAGLGMLSLARIMRSSAEMREELEATV